MTMQIDWWTLALQAVNFLILVWLLWRFLYRPVREVIEKRKRLGEEALAVAAGKEAEAEAARRRFEEAEAELARQRQDMLKRIHEEMEAERREVMTKARQEADRLIEAARNAIDEEREAALAAVREEVAELAVELASNLLRKAGDGAPSDVFLERLVKQLKEMPAEERERLRKDLAADKARLTVVTAVPLAPEERDRWRNRLGASLGAKAKTDFVTDPGIVGGAGLRFPHAVLELTWADQLEKAKDLLRKNEVDS